MTRFLSSHRCGFIMPIRVMDVALVSNVKHRMADGIGGEDDEQAALGDGTSSRLRTRGTAATRSEPDFGKEQNYERRTACRFTREDHRVRREANPPHLARGAMVLLGRRYHRCLDRQPQSTRLLVSDEASREGIVRS